MRGKCCGPVNVVGCRTLYEFPKFLRNFFARTRRTISSALRSEDPKRLGWKFDVIDLVLERCRGVGAHAKIVLCKQQLPALSDIHLRLERHQNAIATRPASEQYFFQPN